MFVFAGLLLILLGPSLSEGDPRFVMTTMVAKAGSVFMTAGLTNRIKGKLVHCGAGLRALLQETGGNCRVLYREAQCGSLGMSPGPAVPLTRRGSFPNCFISAVDGVKLIPRASKSRRHSFTKARFPPPYWVWPSFLPGKSAGSHSRVSGW